MSEHVVPKKIYLAVWGTLMVMTLVTTLVAFVDLGRFNAVIALAIATFKASLVVLFFMHAKYSPRLTRVVITAGIFWLCLLLALSSVDYLTRLWPT
jgi:cytochrome c oxidase subunit 4